MSRPSVSVITVSYNSGENLARSLDMLKAQDYPFIESIIVDGGSTDGSVDVIKEFAEAFENGEGHTCKWVSEPDEGLYYALNKGLDMATGDIIGCYWDLYATEHSLSDLVDAIITQGKDGVHGDLVYMDENEKVVRDWRTGNGRIREGWMPGHPTLYLKREVYDRFGKYSTDLGLSADFEFMVRCLKDEEVELAYVPKLVIKMFYGGISHSDKRAYWNSIKEAYRALKMNDVHPALWIIILRTVRTVFQFRRHSHT